ncbi:MULTISPECIES: glycosyltransferase [unclassified Lacrimispora]|uniref:glycosyltransferase n=1 Tax=unclassified Lacrimispora TaxID=2719232 RepID=UPI00376FAAF4
MDIWMDLTNSMCTWRGGVIGIIRAELEIAYNLKKNYENIRFSICNNSGFVEITSDSLEWLWNADSVTDAYMTAMGRNNIVPNQKQKVIQNPIGLDNAYAFSDSRRERLREAGKLYIARKSPIIKPIARVAFGFIFLPISFASRLRALIKKINRNKRPAKEQKKFSHPYGENDIIFSCGWFESSKEYFFSKLKSENNNIGLVYLVYDIILIKEGTAHLYGENQFDRYIKWIANNSDMILYGGATAQRDTEQYLREHNLPIPKGYPIKFGAEIVRNSDVVNKELTLKKLGIEDKYIMAVGSIEPRKNYETIYQAYIFMLEKFNVDEIPQFVIVGGAYMQDNLVECIKLDPRLKGKIIMLRPSDEELDLIYKNCLFALLPSLYEGWSLTLPEALGYGKLCISSKVDPLIEIGIGITEFVEPLDARAWAERIIYFYQNPLKVKEYEKKIKDNWKVITWNDCAEMIEEKILLLKGEKEKTSLADIYMDLTLAWELSRSGAYVSGILRTQLIIARLLAYIMPRMKFIALTKEGCINIDKSTLAPLFEEDDIETSFNNMRPYLASLRPDTYRENNEDIKQEIQQTVGPFWLFCSVLPKKLHQPYINLGLKVKSKRLSKGLKTEMRSSIGLSTMAFPFNKNDIILSTGTGFHQELYPSLIKAKMDIGFKFIQLIYDLTPILYPQVHMEMTRKYYVPFLKNTSELSDYIFYGGATCMRDAEEYFRRNNFNVKPGYPIKFGSNIVNNPNKEANDKKILENLGIKGPYTLTVGSIEMRKNHESLYKAYLNMINQSEYKIPQMVFAGYPGWKTENFLEILRKDNRVKDKILVISPTDKEMEVLYRNCLFTILASMYEGWSLTLPESLNYGKFCIASDVDPLREIGQDFIDYVHPFDTMKWAEKILYYSNSKEELKKREEKIAREWHAVSWIECAEQITKILNEIRE